MSSIVKYTGSERRHFGGIVLNPGDQLLFDEDFAQEHGRTNPDDYAQFFVHVYTNGGKTPYLELHAVGKDGDAGKATKVDPTKGEIAARFGPASDGGAEATVNLAG